MDDRDEQPHIPGILETHYGITDYEGIAGERSEGMIEVSPKIVPYNTGKVLIGCNYYPHVNYHNEDQDWVQEILLGIERSRLEDNLFVVVMYALGIYTVLGLLTRSWYES